MVQRLDSEDRVGVPWARVRLRGGGDASGFPLVGAYAVSIAKMQGRTLPHIVVLPCDGGFPGVGYVAVSRVRDFADLWWVTRPARSFFVPV